MKNKKVKTNDEERSPRAKGKETLACIEYSAALSTVLSHVYILTSAAVSRFAHLIGSNDRLHSPSILLTALMSTGLDGQQTQQTHRHSNN